MTVYYIQFVDPMGNEQSAGYDAESEEQAKEFFRADFGYLASIDSVVMEEAKAISYEDAIDQYGLDLAHDYLNGGGEYLYDAPDHFKTIYGVSQSKANSDAESAFKKHLAKIRGGEEEEPEEDYDDGDGMTDIEADADTLRMAGWGTDEDYDHYDYDHVERDHDEPYEPDYD